MLANFPLLSFVICVLQFEHFIGPNVPFLDQNLFKFKQLYIS